MQAGFVCRSAMSLRPDQPLAIIQSLRCMVCLRFAYHDLFKGDMGVCGYLCRECFGMIQTGESHAK